MTAFVTISCEESAGPYGRCPRAIHVYDVATIDDARRAAARHGWRHVGGRDLCGGSAAMFASGALVAGAR